MTLTTFRFVAASLATQGLARVRGFEPSRKGEAPSWAGRGEAIATGASQVPLTDPAYWLGRYVLCKLTLRRADGKELEIVDAVCAISRSKNIVTTQMVGRNGTVKEYINDGDYQVNIAVGIQAVRDGVAVDEYPSEGLRTLRSFLDSNEPLGVHSEFLKIFDITSLVVKEFSLTQDTASNYQEVSISCISDEEYNIHSVEY